jgi:MFS family permease
VLRQPDAVGAGWRGPMQVVTSLREPARPTAIREHHLAPWLAVGTVCFGAFMGQLDASVVTVAFPAMQRQFGAGLAEVQWVTLAYLVVVTALLIPVGRLSDRFGRKLAYLAGFALFALSSAACGLAASLAILIALRLVQATGAALLQANSVALVTTSVPVRLRRRALGVQAAAQALGLACGPVTGGLLVATAGWRWIFFINVPVGVVAIVAGWYLLPRSRGLVSGGGTDLVGMTLLAAAVTATMLTISALSGLDVPAAARAGCAAVALAAWGGMLMWERRTAAPLIDPSAFASAGIASALSGALCVYLVLFGPLVLVPQVLAVHGSSALVAGAVLTALPVGFGLAALCGESLIPAHWSDRSRCVGGGGLACCSLAALAIPAPNVVSIVLLGLLGIGLGVYTPANNAFIMAAASHREAATAGGMVNMTRGIGTALGVAVVTLGLHAATSFGHPSAGPQVAFGTLAAAALAATWAGSRLGRQPKRRQPERGLPAASRQGPR